MGKHSNDQESKGGDGQAGGARMGDHEQRHQGNPEHRADEIVKRLKAEQAQREAGDSK